MTKVAVIYHYFAKYREPIISQLINDSGNEFEFIFIADELSNEQKLVVADNKVFSGKFRRVENRWFFKFLWQKGLLSSLREHDPDVIICLAHFGFITTWILALYYKLLGRKIIFWGHGLYGNESTIKRFVRVNFNNIADNFMVYGERAKDLMYKEGKSNTTVIYNSLNYFEQNENFLHLKNDVNCDLSNEIEFKIVFIGRLTPVKKLDQLLNACIGLMDLGYKIKVDIIGDGSETKLLKDICLQSGYDKNFCFHGEVYDEILISKIIYRAHVCVSPGNVGLTAIHSLTYGTPVITHNKFSEQMPEYEAIKDGHNGSFFEYGNEESLKNSIKYWIGEYKRRDYTLIQEDCRNVIKNKYNPICQSKIIRSVLRDV
ncbi:glycosyltransferase family 4 protein [Marinomonas gallaica]|uniref:glycosyltransferase family 4 protein n=1 Tax=Marinomonas gallaica TaxID=1806667 RepID=UPI003A955C6F